MLGGADLATVSEDSPSYINSNSNNNSGSNIVPQQQTIRYTNNSNSNSSLSYNNNTTTTTRLINNRFNSSNIILNNGGNLQLDGGSNSNGVMVTYSNSQDMEVMEQDMDDGGGRNSSNSSQCLSRNSSFGPANISVMNSQNFNNTSNNNNSNNISYHHQLQQPQQHLIQQTQHQPQMIINQQQMDFGNNASINNGNNNNVQSPQGNMSNVASIVSHHQIIGSMKNPPRTLSGNFVQNGSNNQPVLLIYNTSAGVDDQLVQTYNARKILLPKPVIDGQNQQNMVKNNNTGTVLSIASQYGGNNCSNSNADTMEDSVNGMDSESNNMSIAVMKRDDHDDSASNITPKHHFRHLPISGVAQTPSRDQRKGLCVAKKMPRLKPINSKLVSQGTSSVPITVAGTQSQQVIMASQSLGPNQVMFARNQSSHPLIVPQSQTMDMREVSSAYPNMSVVKREPHDEFVEDDDRNEEEPSNTIHSVVPKRRNKRIHSTFNDNRNRKNYYSRVNRTTHNMDKEQKRSEHGRSRQNYIGSTRNKNYSERNNREQQSNFEQQQMDNGQQLQFSDTNDGEDSGPDSAEMLAAQVLASSLGSRQIVMSSRASPSS